MKRAVSPIPNELSKRHRDDRNQNLLRKNLDYYVRIPSNKSKYLLDVNVEDIESFQYCVFVYLHFLQHGDYPDSKLQMQRIACKIQEIDQDVESDIQRQLKQQNLLIDQNILNFSYVYGKRMDFQVNILTLVDNQDVHLLSRAANNIFKEPRQHFINLLQVEVSNENNSFNHRYLLITHLSDFLSQKCVSPGGGRYTYKKHYCEKCIDKGFQSFARYETHTKLCKGFGEQVFTMPEKVKTTLTDGSVQYEEPSKGFSNFRSLLMHPLMISWDLETSQSIPTGQEIDSLQLQGCKKCIEDRSSRNGVRCKCTRAIPDAAGGYYEETKDDEGNSTVDFKLHKCISYSFVISSMNGNIIIEETDVCSTGNAAEKLLQRLIDLEDELLSMLEKITPIKMTELERRSFYSSKKCVICDEDFKQQDIYSWDANSKEENTICRHHHHFTGQLKDELFVYNNISLFFSGQYLGAAHATCNLKVQRPTKIPCICHNTYGFDISFIVAAISKVNGIYNISALAKSTEKLKLLEINRFQFIGKIILCIRI
jgi:hypothetical protein